MFWNEYAKIQRYTSSKVPLLQTIYIIILFYERIYFYGY